MCRMTSGPLPLPRARASKLPSDNQVGVWPWLLENSLGIGFAGSTTYTTVDPPPPSSQLLASAGLALEALYNSSPRSWRQVAGPNDSGRANPLVLTSPR